MVVVNVKNWLTKGHSRYPYTHIEFAEHKGIIAVPVDTQRTNEYIVVIVNTSRPSVCGIEPRIVRRGSKWDGRRWALCWQGHVSLSRANNTGFPPPSSCRPDFIYVCRLDRSAFQNWITACWTKSASEMNTIRCEEIKWNQNTQIYIIVFIGYIYIYTYKREKELLNL